MNPTRIIMVPIWAGESGIDWAFEIAARCLDAEERGGDDQNAIREELESALRAAPADTLAGLLTDAILDIAWRQRGAKAPD